MHIRGVFRPLSEARKTFFWGVQNVRARHSGNRNDRVMRITYHIGRIYSNLLGVFICITKVIILLSTVVPRIAKMYSPHQQMFY